MRDHRVNAATGRKIRQINRVYLFRIHAVIPMLMTLAFLTIRAPRAVSQDLLNVNDSSEKYAYAASNRPYPAYSPPTENAKFRTYVFDAAGPYPIIVAGFVAGVNQLSNTPPEWHQGAEGYGKRLGSNFGIAAVSTTTRYALSEAFKEDTLYYRCDCQGILPRLSHAALSTLTARRGNDGRRVFSVPSLIAPYAGSMTAIYGWYPERYNAKDAFRIGNYSMLGHVGGNIAMEFLFSGPHSLLSRLHLDKMHRGTQDQGPK
jgi:hypothetical protein